MQGYQRALKVFQLVKKSEFYRCFSRLESRCLTYFCRRWIYLPDVGVFFAADQLSTGHARPWYRRRVRWTFYCDHLEDQGLIRDTHGQDRFQVDVEMVAEFRWHHEGTKRLQECNLTNRANTIWQEEHLVFDQRLYVWIISLDFLLYHLDNGVINQHEYILDFDELDYWRSQILWSVSLRIYSKEALFLRKHIAQKCAIEMALGRWNEQYRLSFLEVCAEMSMGQE